jgi:hypothetical protein
MKQAGIAGGADGCDVLMDHDFASFSREGAGLFFPGSIALKLRFGPRSMERHTGQKLGREAESERNHQQHAKAGEYLQRRRRIDFTRIVPVETSLWRIFASFRGCSVL